MSQVGDYADDDMHGKDNSARGYRCSRLRRRRARNVAKVDAIR